VAHDNTDGLTVALLQQEVQNEFQKGNASLPPEVQKPNALLERSVGMAKPFPTLLIHPDPNSRGQK
jgi:hypothetical protein